ncbi:MAG: PAS domain S-box protein [Deltaproteobacteria bacterium]
MFFTKKGKQESRNQRARQSGQECSEEEKVNICFDVQSFAISGYSSEELIGKDASMLVSVEDWEQVRANAIAMLKGERSSPYL